MFFSLISLLYKSYVTSVFLLNQIVIMNKNQPRMLLLFNFSRIILSLYNSIKILYIERNKCEFFSTFQNLIIILHRKLSIF